MRRGLLFLLLFAVFAAPARAGGPAMIMGTAEDAVKTPDLVRAKTNMTLSRLGGFTAVRVSSIWTTGLRAPGVTERRLLSNVVAAARLNGMQVFLTVHNSGNRTTPLTEEARADFAAYTTSLARSFPYVRDFVIGNEPNLNRFWLPQFNTDGTNASAPAYLLMLQKSYDALKAVSRRITVIGGALAPRGGDNPAAERQTHSPTKFLLDLGAAYKASGRARPIMDQLAIHPYGDNSSQPPTVGHPSSRTIALADYGKLVTLLGRAFDGTGQLGSTLPIVYAEYGIESLIPAAKARHYTGREPATVRAVNESTQGRYYRQAIGMAFCQPTVRAMFLFHTFDEPNLDRWQSGLYYVDRTPKSNFAVVRRAVEESRRGVVTRCPGLQLAVAPKVRFSARRRLSGAKPLRLRLTLECDIDCRYTARVERLPRRDTVQIARGWAVGGRTTKITFPLKQFGAGQYRSTVSVIARLNEGPRQSVEGKPFRVEAPPRSDADAGGSPVERR